MYKLLVLLVLFTTFALSIPLVNGGNNRYKNRFLRWIIRDERFIGRHPCASDGVCACWVGQASLRLFIDCSNRNLTEPPKMYKDLNIFRLDLSGNGLRRAPNMTEEGYKLVHILNLNNNFIDNVTENLITPYLTMINLSNNNISRVENSFLQKLVKRRIPTFDLTDNPWICDCKSTALLEFVNIKHYQSGISKIKCVGMDELILDKKHEDFCPGEMKALPTLQIDQTEDDDNPDGW